MKLLRITGAALAAGFPFLLYYASRTGLGVEEMGPDRVIGLELPHGDQLVTNAVRYWDQMQVIFPGTSGVLALFALALILWSWRYAWVAVAGLAIAAFFFLDTVSELVIGYYRYLLHSLPFLVVGLLYFSKRLESEPRQLAALGILSLALMAPSAWQAVMLAMAEPTGRNFYEQYDAPLVFPIKSIVREAEAKGYIASRAPIQASRPDAMVRSFPGETVMFGDFGELFCECTAQHPRVLNLFIRYPNHNGAFGDMAYEDQPATRETRVGMWNLNRQQRPACLVRLRQSCAHVLERYEGGELVAVLGAN